MSAGRQLRDLRNRLGITTREVEEQSRQIAAGKGNREFYVSNAWLSQIETRETTPSIYKLYSLSAIYRVLLGDLLSFFGIRPDEAAEYQLSAPLPNTHLVSVDVNDKSAPIDFPVRFDRGFRTDKTNLVSRMVEIWGEVPIALIQRLDLRKGKWGYIGTGDYMMYPLLRPGSFVQIDDRQIRVQPKEWRTEYDRPIYFVELRDGYACSWCELRDKVLTLIPHPLAPRGIRQLEYPLEAEIVGRVTAVAMRLVDFQPAQPAAGELPLLS